MTRITDSVPEITGSYQHLTTNYYVLGIKYNSLFYQYDKVTNTLCLGTIFTLKERKMKKEKEVFTQEFYEDGGMKSSCQSKEKEDDGSLQSLQIGCALVLMILAFFTINKLLDARINILNHQGLTNVSRR